MMARSSRSFQRITLSAMMAWPIRSSFNPASSSTLEHHWPRRTSSSPSSVSQRRNPKAHARAASRPLRALKRLMMKPSSSSFRLAQFRCLTISAMSGLWMMKRQIFSRKKMAPALTHWKTGVVDHHSPLNVLMTTGVRNRKMKKLSSSISPMRARSTMRFWPVRLISSLLFRARIRWHSLRTTLTLLLAKASPRPSCFSPITTALHLSIMWKFARHWLVLSMTRSC